MSPRSSPKCRALCVSFIHPVIKSLQKSAGFPSIPAVCVAKQQQPQPLQRNGPERHELEPEQGLAAGVHRAQVLRVRRWVTSL